MEKTIINTLTKLMKKTRTEHFSNCLMKANVIPIHKKGIKKDPDINSPISLLSDSFNIEIFQHASRKNLDIFIFD